ncbi:MAG: glutamine--tRNA ligase, partial [Spirochaetales bacterium]
PAGNSFLDNLAEHSLEAVEGAFGEPAIAGIKPGQSVQFERLGYFCADPDSTAAKPIFNRTVTLRDTWAKIEKKGS